LQKDINGQDEYWTHAIESYSRASISKKSDKLVALSGICQSMQSLTQDSYAAGLWHKNIEIQLLWAPTNHARKPNTRRPIEDRAPTWSRASLGGEVDLDRFMHAFFLKHSQLSILIKVLEVKIELASADPFGEVQAAMLKVSCGHLLISKFAISESPHAEEAIPQFTVGETELGGVELDTPD
jgi:hypothetical protein